MVAAGDPPRGAGWGGLHQKNIDRSGGRHIDTFMFVLIIYRMTTVARM
jgi:hypothetical protein